MHLNRHRGLLKLRKGIVKNLHPELQILDETEVPFEGWFDLDLKYFYVNYGFKVPFEKGILSTSVRSVANAIREFENDNLT